MLKPTPRLENWSSSGFLASHAAVSELLIHEGTLYYIFEDARGTRLTSVVPGPKRTVGDRWEGVTLKGLCIAEDGWWSGGISGVHHSIDRGKTWTFEAVPVDEPIQGIASHLGVMWAAGQQGSLLRRVDGTWQRVPRAEVPQFPALASGELPHPRTPFTGFRMLGGRLYVLGQGLWRLDQDGAHLALATEALLVDAALTAQGTLLVAGFELGSNRGRLFRRPAGTEWSEGSQDAVDPSARAFVGVVAMPQGVLLVCSSGEGALRLSKDDGRTFSELPDPQCGGKPLALYVAQRDRGVKHCYTKVTADEHGGAVVAGWRGLMVRVAPDGPDPWIREAKPRARAKKAMPPPSNHRTPIDPAQAQGFLKRIRADFDDDGPRLVYADWLTKHEDPLGEFIQLQCTLGERISGATGRASEPSPLPPDYEQLRHRELQLYKRHRRSWLEPIAPFVRKYGFRRGFVDRIESGPGFFPGAASVFALHPVETLLLQGMKKRRDFDALADTPLPGLRELEFVQQTIPHRCVARLFSSKTLQALPSLSLYACTLNAQSVEAFTQHSLLPGLRQLDFCLHSDCYSDEVLGALGRATSLPRLETLKLWYLPDYVRLGWVSVDGIVAFADQCTLPSLRQIVVSDSLPSPALDALSRRFDLIH